MTSNATIPGEEIPEHFYDAAPLEPHLLYQGEILVDVPILNMPKPTLWLLLRTVKSGRRVHEAIENGSIQGTIRVLDSKTSLAQWYADGNGDYAMGLLDKNPCWFYPRPATARTRTSSRSLRFFPWAKSTRKNSLI